MDFNKTRNIVDRLDGATRDTLSPLPTNDEIRAAARFLLSTAQAKPAQRKCLRGAIEASPLRIDPELVATLRELTQKLERLAEQEESWRRNLYYRPNQIPRDERLRNILFALALSGYAALGVRIDDFLVPLSRRSSVHLHGPSAWVMFAAAVCAVAVLLAVVVDHYDRRDNERHYQAFGKFFRQAGWGLFAGALLTDFYLKLNH